MHWGVIYDLGNIPINHIYEDIFYNNNKMKFLLFSHQYHTMQIRVRKANKFKINSTFGSWCSTLWPPDAQSGVLSAIPMRYKRKNCSWWKLPNLTWTVPLHKYAIKNLYLLCMKYLFNPKHSLGYKFSISSSLLYISPHSQVDILHAPHAYIDFIYHLILSLRPCISFP